MPDDECLTVDALSSKSEYDDDNVDRPDRHFQEAWKMGYFTLRSSLQAYNHSKSGTGTPSSDDELRKKKS